MKKALYGTLRAAYLFWEDLTKELQKIGFKVNPYDPCVANMMIDGFQCTVLWHVNDLKILHKHRSVVTKVIDLIANWYGKLQELLVTRGKVHDYLGMTLDYNTPGEVSIKMEDYVEKILDDARKDMKGTSSTPAAQHLFETDKTKTKLQTEDAEYFHYMVACLLFLCHWGRPDIHTAVAFLTTRVKAPDDNDYKKLCCVVKYLRGTRKLTRVLRADELLIMKWHIDGLFAVHATMRSHTGASLSLGKGAIFTQSSKQKINTKSSTEAELVAVDDVMGSILWTKYFLNAQGYCTGPATVNQDNKSAILLKNNGKRSSGKMTRHIDIRYFFVTDRVKKNNIRIEYCPTGNMIGDFFTKPLQGSAFYKFRDAILNHGPASVQNNPAGVC